MNHFLILRRVAFTLAEVLITLGIIGVVAAMTIPTLMNNIQDNEFKTKMRKEYSVLSEAFQLLKTENGGQIQDSFTTCSGEGDNSCMKNVFKSKFISVKDCDINNTASNCFPAQSSIKYLNGTNANSWYINNDLQAALITNDGATFAFWLDSPACTSNYGPGYTNECGWVTVDVNGIKPPNTWGRDIYLFFIYADVIRPCLGGVTTSVIASDDCGTGANYGYTCASKYLLGQ